MAKNKYFLSLHKGSHFVYVSAKAREKLGGNFDFLCNAKTHEIAVVSSDNGRKSYHQGVPNMGRVIRELIKSWGYEVKRRYELTWHEDTKCFTFCVEV